MNRLNIFSFLLSFSISLTIFSQETLKVMYYNLLTFPQTQPDRIDTLKKITTSVIVDTKKISSHIGKLPFTIVDVFK